MSLPWASMALGAPLPSSSVRGIVGSAQGWHGDSGGVRVGGGWRVSAGDESWSSSSDGWMGAGWIGWGWAGGGRVNVR
eukprot:CAMPEP_0196231692 /NCGR_PEP_ID=MMETSP0913-20130531/2413_1 /TAXON_ID=49265 /ORGANISM="Thalassiosira rotula, Strain GSO102" /LENGTH=77 /DNA_ID=CAMNT_0041511917 /DNA_START=513 /DNA_END=741 /DNA_ORIENTATION=-